MQYRSRSNSPSRLRATHGVSFTLLLIEDDDAIAELVLMHLREAGFAVEHERDRTRAIQAVSRRRYDLVVLDLMLPGTDGLDICRHIRSAADYVRSSSAHVRPRRTGCSGWSSAPTTTCPSPSPCSNWSRGCAPCSGAPTA